MSSGVVIVVSLAWAVALIAALFGVVLPLFRVELKRRASRSIRPAPEQIWVQDGELIYVTDANTTGVELMAWNSERREVYRWKDTWPEWQARLRARSIFYTGEKRPLGGS